MVLNLMRNIYCETISDPFGAASDTPSVTPGWCQGLQTSSPSGPAALFRKAFIISCCKPAPCTVPACLIVLKKCAYTTGPMRDQYDDRDNWNIPDISFIKKDKVKMTIFTKTYFS